RDHIQDFLPFINWLIRIIEEKKNKTNKRTLVVGIYGPSSSGKSTLVDILIKKLSEIYELPNQTGIKVNFLSSDSYLHPSQFRYIQSKNKRFTFIKGQPIYNLHRFWRDLVDLLGKKTISTPYDEHAPGVQQKGKDRKIDGSQLEVLVIDFTCFGLDEFILEKVDLLVPVLFKDDTFRLARRLVRDTKPEDQGGRNLSFRSILDDMTEKQYQELYQTMKYIVKNYGNYLWLQDEKKIYRNKSSSPINIKAPFSSDLTEKEKQVIDNEIKKAYDEGRIKPLTISEAIKGILKESGYLSILKDLEENKLIVKAVDLGSDLGFRRQKEEDGLIFAYTRKEQNTIVIYLSGSLAFLLDSSNYINEALIKDIKKDTTLTAQQKQEKIKSLTGPLDLAFAQIILHEYMLANNFSYQYALTAELSLENKLKGISVLSRFIILKLAELGNLSYLNKVLKQYNPQVDFDQELKNILIEAYRLYLKLYLRVEQIQLFNEDAFGIISLAKQKAIEDINSEIDESLKKAKISKEQDIRATANGSLLYEIGYRIGRALGEDLTKDLQDYIGNWPKEVNKVGIGIDARISSERIRSALKDGLLDSGINVVEFREHLTTTPMISFAGYKYQDLDLVINITASHNDYTYNGIKIVYVQKDSEGKTQDVINIETEILNNLLKVAGNLSLGTNQQILRGSLEERDILTFYKSHVKEYLLKVLGAKREEKPLSGYKFAVDASSGTGGFYAKILEELGAEVLEINIAPNGYFPSHMPDPEKEGTKEALAKVVKDNNCHSGVIFDSDCDRVGFVDENGNILDGHDLLKFLAKRLVSSGQKVVFNSRTSLSAFKVVEENNGKAYLEKSGYAFIKAKVRELQKEGNDVAFAGEESAHIMLKDNYFIDDGLITASAIFGYLVKEKTTLSEAIDKLPCYLMIFVQPKLTGSDDKNLLRAEFTEISNQHLQYYQNNKQELNIIEIWSKDGNRVTFEFSENDFGWLLLRQSLSTPNKLYIDIEGSTEEAVRRIAKITYNVLTKQTNFSNSNINFNEDIQNLQGNKLGELIKRAKQIQQQKTKKDPARPLSAQPTPTQEEVLAEIQRHDIDKFEVITLQSPELKLALEYLRSINEYQMASYLEYLAKQGLIRAGPLKGFLATTYQDDQGTEYILLSNLYPEYNTSLQRACSLVHESGATSKFNKEHIYNSLREYEFLLWAFKDVQEGQAIAKSLVPIISTKKSPGTSSLESRETLFLKELAFALHRENLSCIYDIENTLIKFIMGVWRIKNEDMNGILDTNREPVTFKERTLYLLKTGKVKFVIDDLEQANQKHLLEGLASTFGILTLPQKDDYYLYSRFKPDNDPSGVLSFLICGYMNSNGDIISEEEYKTKGEEIKKLKEGVEKNKEKDNISEA
ncbi:MAG: hypothetical protein NC822_06035, partial [Candidatus Omnitrophica bacterium]|nr:hypothetical protein [Candidatus Omnitrophota bacterium]